MKLSDALWQAHYAHKRMKLKNSRDAKTLCWIFISKFIGKVKRLSCV